MAADLSEELEFHRAEKQRELERSGVPDAESASRRALGNATHTREDARAVWVWRWLDDLQRDVEYSFRSLRRDRGFSVVVVLTLGLGIGATAAIISVLNTVLWRPLPYADPDNLVRIFRIEPAVAGSPSATVRRASLGTADLAAFRSLTQTLSHVGMFGIPTTMWRTGVDETSRLHGLRVSPAIFPMLGAQPIIGRTFEAREETPGAGSVAILSYAAWQRHFAGDPTVLGRSVAVDSAVPSPVTEGRIQSSVSCLKVSCSPIN
jgi:hypothetical protein